MNSLDDLTHELTARSQMTADWWLENAREISAFLIELEPNKMALLGMLFLLGGAVMQAAVFGKSLSLESAKSILCHLANCAEEDPFQPATMGTMQ